MASTNVSVLEDLQTQLEHANIPFENLSILAQTGDERLVEKFLTENIKIEGSDTDMLQCQLYVASFWGMKEIVKELLQKGTEPNRQNKSTLWSPLHAATFQEHGPIVMQLLEHKADPLIQDFEGRTPNDFASASDKIWPHFAVRGLTRTTKETLIDKGVIRKIPGTAQTSYPNNFRMTSYNCPESAYAYNKDPAFAAAVDGDVLADDEGRQLQITPSFNLWR